jgi:hypothetical protein
LDDAARQWVSPSFSQLPYFIHLCPLIYIYILSTRAVFHQQLQRKFPSDRGPTPNSRAVTATSQAGLDT